MPQHVLQPCCKCNYAPTEHDASGCSTNDVVGGSLRRGCCHCNFDPKPQASKLSFRQLFVGTITVRRTSQHEHRARELLGEFGRPSPWPEAAVDLLVVRSSAMPNRSHLVSTRPSFNHLQQSTRAREPRASTHRLYRRGALQPRACRASQSEREAFVQRRSRMQCAHRASIAAGGRSAGPPAGCSGLLLQRASGCHLWLFSLLLSS